jgi:hypothetical protein
MSNTASPIAHNAARSDPYEATEAAGQPAARVRGRVEDEWGRSESLDPDNVGDIADEGMGHRG